MKNSHKLVLIAVVAALGLLLANRLYQPEYTAEQQSPPLLPDLTAKADQLSQITIRQHSQHTQLKKGEHGWVVTEKQDYPADMDKLRQLLQQLAEARLVEKKTSKENYLPRLNLAEPDAEQGAGTLLSLRFGDQEEALILGKTAKGGGRMARRANEHQAWRVKPAPQPMADPMQWLDTQIVNIAPEVWQSVRVEPAKGSGWTLARAKPEDRNFTLEPMPAGKTFKDENINRTLVTALQMLNFTEVRKADPEADAINSLYYHGWFGDRLKVDIFADNGTTWFAFHFEPGPEPEQKPDSEDNGPDAQKHDLKTLEINQWNQRLQGWWYKLPDYKASQLNRSKQDLLKDKEENKPDTAAKDQASEPNP